MFWLLSGAAAVHQHPEGGGLGDGQPADCRERTSHHCLHLCGDTVCPGGLGGRARRRPGDAPPGRSPRPRGWIHHHGDVPTGGAGQPRGGARRDHGEVAAGLCETVQRRLHLRQWCTLVKTRSEGPGARWCCWTYEIDLKYTAVQPRMTPEVNLCLKCIFITLFCRKVRCQLLRQPKNKILDIQTHKDNWNLPPAASTTLSGTKIKYCAYCQMGRSRSPLAFYQDLEPSTHALKDQELQLN